MRNIIFDFDGVIADTEPVFYSVWSKYMLTVYRVETSKKFWDENLKGISSIDKSKVLAQFGISLSDDERAYLLAECIKELKVPGKITLTSGVVDLAEKFTSCIATGGKLSATLDKINVLNIEHIFSEDKVFTIDHVKRGKPEPDLFLYAAEKMNAEPKDCVVVEDGIPGLKAALAAGMIPIAFCRYLGRDVDAFVDEAMDIGVEYFCFDMDEVYDTISCL